MTSERQYAANHRNAQRSTGPRTPEGRAASSRNALTHGLLAENPLLSYEDPAQFEELRSQFMSHYEPVGVIENQLVERVSSLSRRLSRVSRIEAEVLESEANAAWVSDLMAQKKTMEQEALAAWADQMSPSPARPAEPRYSELQDELREALRALSGSTAGLGESFRNGASGRDVISRLVRYETHLQRSLYSSIAELERLQANRIERRTVTFETGENMPVRRRTRPVRTPDNDET